jgi:hypothetical protein
LRAHRVGELLELGLVERGAWLVRARVDKRDAHAQQLARVRRVGPREGQLRADPAGFDFFAPFAGATAVAWSVALLAGAGDEERGGRGDGRGRVERQLGAGVALRTSPSTKSAHSR